MVREYSYWMMDLSWSVLGRQIHFTVQALLLLTANNTPFLNLTEEILRDIVIFEMATKCWSCSLVVAVRSIGSLLLTLRNVELKYQLIEVFLLSCRC